MGIPQKNPRGGFGTTPRLVEEEPSKQCYFHKKRAKNGVCGGAFSFFVFKGLTALQSNT